MIQMLLGFLKADFNTLLTLLWSYKSPTKILIFIFKRTKVANVLVYKESKIKHLDKEIQHFPCYDNYYTTIINLVPYARV